MWKGGGMVSCRCRGGRALVARGPEPVRVSKVHCIEIRTYGLAPYAFYWGGEHVEEGWDGKLSLSRWSRTRRAGARACPRVCIALHRPSHL